MPTLTISDLETIDAIVVIASVAGESKACLDRGDLLTAHTRQEFYALAAEVARAAGGRVIKAVGSAVLFTFPRPRAPGLLTSLGSFQDQANHVWNAFDPRCHVQLRIGAGSVVAGPMGPPDDLRWDVCGDTVNRLFKMSAGEFVFSPEAQAAFGDV